MTQATFEFDPSGILERNFWAFHIQHPEVYDYLLHFARDWRKVRGPDAHLGIGALFERVRWEIGLLAGDAKESPKLNNNHRAFYARLMMDRHNDLEGIFQLRQQRRQASIGPSNGTLPPGEHIIGV